MKKIKFKKPDHLNEYERGMHKATVYMLHLCNNEIEKLKEKEVEPNTPEQIHAGGRKSAYNRMYQKLINKLNNIEANKQL